MKIQYNGSSKVVKRLAELANQAQDISLRQDNSDISILYWTGPDGTETVIQIPDSTNDMEEITAEELENIIGE